MPTKKEKEMLLKREEFMKAMNEERESEIEEDLEVPEPTELPFNIEEPSKPLSMYTMLQQQIAKIEERLSVLEGKNSSAVKDVKFPGVRGTIGEPRKLKFPRQTGEGNYYTSYK